MLQASFILLAAGLVALIFGLTGTAGLGFELGRAIWFALLSASILTFLVSLWRGRRTFHALAHERKQLGLGGIGPERRPLP